MITFLYGKTGTGKTQRVLDTIEEKLKNGDPVIVLCPEQEAVIAETRLTERFLGRVPTDRLEVLNFGRLPERVFREYGGLTRTELGDGGRRLIMHRALAMAAPHLKEYGASAADRSMVDRLLGAVSEFKMCCVTPEQLEEASRALGSTGGAGGRLRNKLGDFSLLYTLYEKLLHTLYADPQDALTALDEVLRGEGAGFFSGCYVVLDGFYGFTAQQYAVISHIFRTAADVTVTLACNRDGERDGMLRRINETEARLFRIAREAGKEVRCPALTENRRTDSLTLRFLWEHLWKLGSSETIEAEGTVQVLACSNPFTEAEAVAAEIRRQVLAGRRYRDITVILRDVERYEGVLDVMLESYGIPCYTSRRTPASSKPFFRYLSCLFALETYHYRRQDMIGLLKTNLTGIAENDAFLYENYITTWNLSGNRLTEEDDYTMHPLGYREEVTEHDLAVLETVNRVKNRLLSLVLPFFDGLRERKTATVKEIAAALFAHLEEAGIPGRLAEQAEREAASGDPAAAEETRQLWQVFVGALDTLVTVSGEVPCRLSDFPELLALLTDDLDIGTIPARSDEVVIGDASLLRPDNASVVILMGVTDGVFPKSPAEDSLFSDYEKDMLAGVGVELSENTAAQMWDELFYFYNAAAAAKEQLILTYPRADLGGKAFHPSVGLERVFAMFSDVRAEDPGKCGPEYGLVSDMPALETMARCRGTDLGRALSDYFEERAEDDPALKRKLASMRQPIVRRRDRLSKQTLTMLFGDGSRPLAMTQSRLEAYVLCRFSYFCDYVLKLKEQKRAAFGAADIGSFIHYVLEGFMARYTADEDREKYEDDAYLSELVGQLLGEYLRAFRLDGDKNGQNRLQHLFTRLHRTTVVVVKNLIREMAAGDFLPRDFELPVGADDGTGIPALRIDAPNGLKIRLFGKIDRVDTYEKDGKTYLRVVDYKTYVKRFSLDDVAAGINMQMLLYLFSVWKMGGGRYAGELTPAGILYMSASPAEASRDRIPTAEEAADAAEEGMKRSGLFLDDPAVLDAMEHGLQGKFIPVKLKKDGTYYSGAPVETLERFGTLMNEVEATVCAIAAELRDGIADAVPISRTHPETGKDPCAYCGMKPVCRARF